MGSIRWKLWWNRRTWSIYLRRDIFKCRRRIIYIRRRNNNGYYRRMERWWKWL
jgi:hypothetical protein